MSSGASPSPAVAAYRAPVDLDVGQGVWREGPRVVMLREGRLPDRCIRCNAPAHGRTHRQHVDRGQAELDAGTLLSIWFGVVLFRRTTYQVSIDIGLCARHEGVRRLWGALAVLAFVAAGCAFLVSVSIERGGGRVFACGAVIAAIGGMLRQRSRVPARVSFVDEHRVVLAGISQDFVTALPTSLPPT